MLVEILIHGAATSGVYAMLAIGFTLIFGVARVLNFAHGSFYALAAYLFYVLAVLLKWPLALASVVAVAVICVYAWLLERYLVRPVRATPLAVLMTTLAISMAVEQALLIAFGSETKNVPGFVDMKFEFFGADVGGQRLLATGVAVVSIASLLVFLQRTRLGTSILAIAQDVQAAEYVGIPVNRVYGIIMMLSAALAALAAIVSGPFFNVQPAMGWGLMTKAFAIVIVGGLGSIWGSILAALLIGYAETIVAFLLSSAWQELVALVAVLLTLVWRPAGLLGVRQTF